ncbi:RNA-binding protein 25-like isoform X2 [Mangifera indica]|uniref:RNA-binding protein 25-like isoform X2 n=1 Tax=Mangifera indica TaxID=29780 RepID=UPI001CFBA6D3|nr:RNA-binding protein 25-like isoform X2 [Mangifera indica]XP_044492127.1 RNA-binding protein 25-like isoform X2 [Mangifera indica]XP_044492128.1 RNA-binding protein 25-like isoform X2 [Mangifera indica]XP_044492129.1 RNA-binding protein 25-like isoform X2 [Mangifera indica]XP_044492130.1 RNA-binding protein 25-like isoform X2 [Mangifera indica]
MFVSIYLGLPRYPAPYPAMVRPVFPPRPPGPVGVLPGVARPPVPGIAGVRPIIPPVVRPTGFPVGTPAEKPETTVYVGKIASTADNDFMLSLLQVCGPVKSWKRPQHPSNGTLKGFGFCEFESVEAVLRALRLLSKFNIDGQELMLNVTQATRDYLERYVEKKTENTKKLRETQDAGSEKEDGSVQGVEKNDPPKASEDLKKDSEAGEKKNHDNSNFGIVTDEDREADQEAMEKLKSMIEDRLKANPLPPAPVQSTLDGSGSSNSELPVKIRDGDSDVDIPRNDVAEDKIDDETASDTKATSEHDRPETSSPDRSRTYDSRSRDRDRERGLKREKEREIDRYEREAEREHVRKEREQRRKIEEFEREYERCLKDWEYREREREKERQYEKEREKERERKRKKEILYGEEDEDDDSRKRWHRSVLEDKKRKRLREKEDDFSDKIKEEEEIAKAKKRAEEEQLQQQQRDALKLLSGHGSNGTENPSSAEESGVETKDKIAVGQDYDGYSIHENHVAGDEVLQNGTGDESTNASVSSLDMWHSSNAPARKLGFGLVGSGKRTAVPSVFHEEDDDDAEQEKKMRPLVPIDYSTEELQVSRPIASGANQPNLAAAAEFAKSISNVNSKEENPGTDRERSRRSHNRSSQHEKDRSAEDSSRSRDENKEKILDRDRDWENGLDKVKTPDNKKLLDAKQLIDMIPKTKEELFAYEINWAAYDEHKLHERMRPWISKKIREFLGEEETTLVDYIVSSTQEHVKASQMLELLQTILDEEAEMFVLKMWRMLIFEIKKVETGLALRSRS